MAARVHFTSPIISSGVKKYTLGGKTSRLLYKLAGGGNPFTPILDLYSGATMGFSLLQISSEYTGDCIKVRRSSDNTEAFIGFKNGALDKVALLAFCGSGDGYVTIWYDQSGNGKDGTQVTALRQPQIVSNGAVIMEGGKPTILFNSTYLEVPSTIVSNINTIYHVVQKNLTSDRIVSIGNGQSTTGYAFFHNQLDNIPFQGTRLSRGGVLNKSITTLSIAAAAATSGAEVFQIRLNGVGQAFTLSSDIVAMSVQFIGALRPNGQINSINGKLSECVIWSGQELNLTELSDDVNTNYNAY